VIVIVVDFPASIPPVRSGGTSMVVGGAFAIHQLRPKECHRGTANTRPCEPPARTIRFRIVAGEALPDVSRCLAFMSPLEVARFAFSTLTCSGLEPTAQTDGKSPASESPGAKHALSCLGNGATFAPNARSRTASEGRNALRRVPNVAPIKSALETPTPPSPRRWSAFGSVKISARSRRC
jgi:hypothetical protein